MLTATRLLWQGAGRPDPEHALVSDVPCWWCGLPSPGLAAPLGATVPKTFPWQHLAACPASEIVCGPCAWSLCDRVSLPPEQAMEGLGKRIEAGGRLRASVRGDDPGQIRLFLRLADGRIGVWSSVTPAGREGPWMEAREALRQIPETVGPCELLDVVEDRDISAGPTARFRNYHHLGTPTAWRPCTNADRAVLREWLLAPPGGPWVCVIGDGQKHAAVMAADAVVHPGDMHAAYVDGAVARWRPGQIGPWLDAIEHLRLAGASDDEVRSGRYTRAGLAWTLAHRHWEPLIRDARGRPALMDLLLFLRRLPKEITDAD